MMIVEKNIEYLDGSDSRCSFPSYYVRKSINKVIYQKIFQIRKYQSKEVALLEARKWKDSIMYNNKITSKRKRIQKSYGKRNSLSPSTGVIGVVKSYTYDKRRDFTYLTYAAYFTVNGKQDNKSIYVGVVDSKTLEPKTFSTDTEFKAFRYAVLIRELYNEYIIRGEEKEFPVRRIVITGWKERPFSNILLISNKIN